MSLSRVPSWCCWPRLCRSRVYTAVSGVAPRPCLPSDSLRSWSYHQPIASSFFDQTARTRVDLLHFLGHQVVDGGILEDGIAIERFLQEAAGHGRSAEQHGANVESHDRGGQQAGRGEDAEASADIVGDREDVVVRVPFRPDQVAELPLRSGDGHEDLAQNLRARTVERASLRSAALGRRPPSPACRPDLLTTIAPQRSSRSSGSTQVLSSSSRRSWRASLSKLLPSK